MKLNNLLVRYLCFVFFGLVGVVHAEEAKPEAGAETGGKAEEKDTFDYSTVDFNTIAVSVAVKGNDKGVKRYVENIKSSSSVMNSSIKIMIVDDVKKVDAAKIGFTCALTLERETENTKLKSMGGGWSAVLDTANVQGTYASCITSKGKWKKIGSGDFRFWERYPMSKQISALVLGDVISVKAKDGNRTNDVVSLTGSLGTDAPLQITDVTICAPFTKSAAGWGGAELKDQLVAPVVNKQKATKFSIQAPLYELADNRGSGSRDLRLNYSWQSPYVSGAKSIEYFSPVKEEPASAKKEAAKGEEAPAKADAANGKK